ncbi:type IV pilin protein [Congregibacter litoralis]|uniref:Prepilin-type N-terminal cleavage/methylation domain protein n=1 Tax=Congregibacter litoralis KT71 TaxID=314285 RepID=A4ADT9_9GAMM|nr:type IV pilin protein [Congregibacter litoralis]EAQ95821.2 prepilin-type N-terminal cleavage/methylation domain protein [Congregibacter litoralis KT71]
MPKSIQRPSPAFRTKAPRHSSGFTLIELMIVVVIVAILAAVALPSYQNSVMKTWRSKAQGCLTEMAQGMERRFTAALSYEGPAATPGLLPPSSCTTEDGMAARYAFDFTADPTANAFTLRATPQGDQATLDAACGNLTIDQTGLRGATGSGALDLCW